MPSMQLELSEASSVMECLKSHAHCLAVTAEHLCVAGKDTTVRVLNTETGESLHTLEGHSHDVNALVIVGSTLFSGADAKGYHGNTQFLKAWDLTSGQALHNLEGHNSGVWALAAGKGLLFSGDEDGSIRVWANPETAECTCVQVLKGHEAKVRCLYYCDEDERLYSTANDSKVLVWDPSSGEQVGSFETQGGWITAVLVASGMVFAASTDKTVFVYDKATGERRSILNHDSWVSSLAFYDSVLYTGVGDGTVCVWEPQQAHLKCKLKGHLEFHAVSSLVTRDSSLFSAAWDGAVTKWDTETVQEFAAAAVVDSKPLESVDKHPSSEVAVDSSNIFDENDCVELLD